MSTVQDAETSDYYGYEFAQLLNGASIVRVTNATSNIMFGRDGNLTQNGDAIIQGTQVLIQWVAQGFGPFMTSVTVTASDGSGPYTVSGEIMIGSPDGCGTCNQPWQFCQCPACDQTSILLPVIGGPKKSELIKDAYGWCGQSDTEYELNPDEYDRALGMLEGMMWEWLEAYGVNLNWNFASSGNGDASDPSGIPFAARQVVSTQLAQRIAPTIGKQFQMQKWMGEAWGNLRTAYSRPPQMELGRGTIVGKGNRWRSRLWGPYFPVRIICPTPLGYNK